jgi:hypothetical protein
MKNYSPCIQLHPAVCLPQIQDMLFQFNAGLSLSSTVIVHTGFPCALATVLLFLSLTQLASLPATSQANRSTMLILITGNLKIQLWNVFHWPSFVKISQASIFFIFLRKESIEEM